MTDTSPDTKPRSTVSDPITRTTVSQLANSLAEVKRLEQLRIIGILRRYPARAQETRDALWSIEREILRGTR